MDKRTELSIDLLCAGARKALAQFLFARGSEDAKRPQARCADSAKSLDEMEMRRA
jgi:hypothetical protein